MPNSLESEDRSAVSNGVMEQLFLRQPMISIHLSGPKLLERQAYLGKLLEVGHEREFVRNRALMILHIVQGGWLGQNEVTESHIVDALIEWRGEAVPTGQTERLNREKRFLAAARSWAKFWGTYHPLPAMECRFDREVHQFAHWLRHDLGLLDSSIKGPVTKLRRFLVWLSPDCLDLSHVTMAEVDSFILARRHQGISRKTVLADCSAIRNFFRYAEERGMNREKLHKTVQPPFLRDTPPTKRCPPWREIRCALKSLDTSKPSHIRARAMLFLASIYGLRRSEIANLTLEDFDWKNEILTVRRSKRGRTQQFPLVFEVGEAVIRYLRIRPRSTFRHVFLTFTLPYRPAPNFGSVIRKVLDRQHVFQRSWGMHAFRHACATELLRKGTSLQGIAEFLGHRDVRSVSIYAHSDLRALRDVAAFNLKNVPCD